MFYTIYKITNQIDGKFYVGSHKTKDLNDNYMGSGKYLKHAQEKYGIENFEKEILFVFETAEEMFAKEAEIVNEDFLAIENTYNLKIGGFGGFDYINSKSTEDAYRKEMQMRLSKTLDVLYEKYGVTNPAQTQSARTAISQSMKQRHANKTAPTWKSFSGRNHSVESKKKISENNKITSAGTRNSQYGTMWITDGIVSKKVKNSDLIPEGWHRGRSK
jgi:hypothetical protein